VGIAVNARRVDFSYRTKKVGRETMAGKRGTLDPYGNCEFLQVPSLVNSFRGRIDPIIRAVGRRAMTRDRQSECPWGKVRGGQPPFGCHFQLGAIKPLRGSKIDQEAKAPSDPI